MDSFFYWITCILFHKAVISECSINLAFRKPATQSTTLASYTADRVVDGNRGKSFFEDKSCSHTAHGETQAWWQVNLLEICTINELSIYYRRNYSERFWGFHLYISNSTDWSSGYLCYQHDGPQLPKEVQNISCSAIGQFVTIANFRNQSRDINMGLDANAYMELCEVEVLGCPFGKYGNKCKNYCSENCRQGNCNPDTGKCPERCKTGYKGIKCNEACDYGSFGTGCRGRCYCMQGTCDTVTGECPTGGCQGGWKGISCSEACLPFTYGPNCKYKCHCKNETCSRYSGKCPHGCVEGWIGTSCNKQCVTCVTDHPRKIIITYLIIVAVILLITNVLSCSIYFSGILESEPESIENKIFNCKGGARLSYNLHISNPAYDINKQTTDELDNTA